MALTLDLVTPEKLVSSEEFSMVVVPGADGEFGVLENHSPLISAINSGVINAYDGDTIKRRIFVTGGFAEVTGQRCTILATEAFDLDKFSKKEANDLLSDVREKLAICIIDKDQQLLSNKVTIIEQLVDLCG